MDQFTAFMAQLDKTLAQEQLSSTDLVYVPVTFSFHNQRLQVAINMLQTSYNVFGVPDILDRIRMLVSLELADRPQSRWPTKITTQQLTITPHKMVRVIPVDMRAYQVE